MSKKKPRFRKIKTYEHLTRLYQSWGDGYLPSLAVVGRGGLGKSHQYEDMLRNAPHLLFKGRTSAISLYEGVKDCPHHPIVFDDIRTLMKDSSCLDLLKQLCDAPLARPPPQQAPKAPSYPILICMSRLRISTLRLATSRCGRPPLGAGAPQSPRATGGGVRRRGRGENAV